MFFIMSASLVGVSISLYSKVHYRYWQLCLLDGSSIPISGTETEEKSKSKKALICEMSY